MCLVCLMLGLLLTFCRVSDYALSDGGNRFSQFGFFSYRTKTTFFRQAFQFNVGREILGAAKQAKISPRSHFERPPRHIWWPVSFLALRKILLTGKLFRLRVHFFSLFRSGKLFPFLTVSTRTNIFTQSAIKRESALC